MFIRLLLFGMMVLPTMLQAQTDTVLLQDGSGNTLGTYTTIQAAYNAIHAPLNQPYVLLLKSYSYKKAEHYPIRFTEKAGASAVNNITIRLAPSIPYSLLNAGLDTAETIVFDGAKWVILDGEYPDPEAPYGIHFGTIVTNTSARAVYPIIRFINGAEHNTLRYCGLFSGMPARYRQDESRILFDTTTNSSGNSFNLIEHCEFITNNCIRSTGNIAHPNSGNIFRNNQFSEIYDTAIHIEYGTAATLISNNFFQPGASPEHLTLVSVNYLEDSTKITCNTFGLNSKDSGVTGILLAPALYNASGSVCLIANNYFSDGAFYFLVHNSMVGPESRNIAETIIPIEVLTEFPTNALIAHNTVRIMPFPGLRGTRPLYSATLKKSGNNAGGSIQVINNILQNHRQGGGAGSVHCVLDIADTSGMALDYNNYGSLDTIARIGSLAFMHFADYRAASSLQDINSNDSAVLFESIDTHYLSTLMATKPWIYGNPLSAVPNDKDGNARTQPYRGADELTLNCGQVPYNNSIYKLYSNDVCPGEKVFLQYAENSWLAPVLPARGFIHQWQSRTLTGNFLDIPGANTAELATPQTQYTIYRMKDSCVSSGQIYYSNWIAAAMNDSAIVLDSISVKPLSMGIYQFTVYNAGLPINYYWTFSDGQTTISSSKPVQLAFYTPGTYTVTVYPDGWCGLPISKTFTVGDPPPTASTIIKETTVKVYPNPANTYFTIEGAEGATALLTNGIGQKAMQFSINAERQVMDISKLPAGMYLLQITDAKGNRGVMSLVKE